jgi:hypothetical protein
MSTAGQLYLFMAIGLLVALGAALIVTALAAGRVALSKPRFRLIGVIGAVGIVILMIAVSNILPTFSPLWIVILASITFGLVLRHVGQSRS